MAGRLQSWRLNYWLQQGHPNANCYARAFDMNRGAEKSDFHGGFHASAIRKAPRG